jgi:hypothetical protein
MTDPRQGLGILGRAQQVESDGDGDIRQSRCEYVEQSETLDDKAPRLVLHGGRRRFAPRTRQLSL